MVVESLTVLCDPELDLRTADVNVSDEALCAERKGVAKKWRERATYRAWLKSMTATWGSNGTVIVTSRC